MANWYIPVDPECPVVLKFSEELFNDPMTVAMGAPTGDIVRSFEKKHRSKCSRCQEFGAANIDVQY